MHEVRPYAYEQDRYSHSSKYCAGTILLGAYVMSEMTLRRPAYVMSEMTLRKPAYVMSFLTLRMPPFEGGGGKRAPFRGIGAGGWRWERASRRHARST